MKENYSQAEAMSIEDKCEELYSDSIQSVINYCDSLALEYAYCNRCENNYPIISTDRWSACCVCGQSIPKI